MRSPIGILIGACLLSGCSPAGKSSSPALLEPLAHTQGEAASAVAETADSDASPQLASQVQSYASSASEPGPGLASTSGGLAGLFSAFRTERAPQPEPPPPGEFIAPEQAPRPASRPEYGDRPKVDLIALARAEAERVEQAGQTAAPASALNPVRAQALAGSLNAYERREAGIPDDEDDDELEQVAVKPAAPQKLTFVYTPARFEISGGQPLPLLGAMPSAGGNGLSSNGLALNAPAQRWRAAYDNVETDCFPQQLRYALNTIAAHFKGEVLVTSGARATGRRGSLHRSCKAADIRIAGVSPADLAAYARTVPGLNGVGSYRRVSVTHIDVRDERFAWRW